MLVQVVHRGLDRPGVGGGEDLLGDVVGERPDERNALGGGESEVEAVHALIGERAARGRRWGRTVVEPDPAVSVSAYPPSRARR